MLTVRCFLSKEVFLFVSAFVCVYPHEQTPMYSKPFAQLPPYGLPLCNSRGQKRTS